MSNKQDASTPPDQPAWMSYASLAITLHLISVGIALSGNLHRSLLQGRALRVLRPYLQLLHLDPDGVPLWLTHGDEDDAGYQIQVLPVGGQREDASQWQRVDAGVRGLETRLRWQKMGRFLAVLAREDDEDTSARIASDISRYCLLQNDLRISGIRCIRHLLQRPEEVDGANEARRNPDDPTFLQVAYEARVLINDAGMVRIIKTSSAAETAGTREDDQ